MHKIRDLLDLLDVVNRDAVDRLADMREVGGRSRSSRLEGLARSYRGDHEAFVTELKKNELIELLNATTAEHGKLLSRPRSYSKPELELLALSVFADGRIPSEFESVVDDDDDDDLDDDLDDDVEGVGGSRLRSSRSSYGASPVSRSSESSGSSSAQDFAPVGHLLAGRYRIIRTLGAGGFGVAYEVESEHPRRTLVAKVAHRDDGSLQNEFEKVRFVDHPNVCRVYGHERDKRWGPFLLVQHGGRAAADIARKGLPPTEVMRIARLAAEGLDHLHSCQIVHGDVNPGNLLVDDQAQVRLADFGISGFLTRASPSAGVSREATQMRGAHPQYSAVEVLRGRPPNARSDQTSLALAILYLLVGESRFLLDPRAGLTDAPATFRAAIDRAMHPDPGARFGNCASFVSTLVAG
jgi:hypothetical protein